MKDQLSDLTPENCAERSRAILAAGKEEDEESQDPRSIAMKAKKIKMVCLRHMHIKVIMVWTKCLSEIAMECKTTRSPAANRQRF